jgi:phosphoribosylformylglycinamidine synthase subunit PurSL
MNSWKVFVRTKPRFADHRGEEVKKAWAAAGHKGLKSLRAGQAYELTGVSEEEAHLLADNLLADPVTQESELLHAAPAKLPSGTLQAQVWLKSGVADPVADTVLLAARDLGVKGLSGVRSGHVYDFSGVVLADDVRIFCEEHLMNGLVQRVEVL